MTPKVDLHGLKAHIGEERLRRYMEDQLKNRVPEVLVIHGHGQGVMREIAYQWIESHANRVRSHEPRNNEGAVLIRLK
jgi:DNA-nicking Smr family endonuclease